MSEAENFLARWVRRKHQAAERADSKSFSAPEPSPPVVPPKGGHHGDTDRPEPAVLNSRLHGNEREKANAVAGAKQAESVEPAFDLAKLPPLESISAETDIRAFLAPGVPPELSRAALRRAWSADPTIRDFVGLSENSWDFNAPGAIPGFGPLQMTDELRHQIARMVGGLAKPAGDEPAAINDAPHAQDYAETGADLPTTPAPTTARGEEVGHHEQRLSSAEETGSPVPSSQRTINDAAAQPNSAGSDHREPVVRRSHGGALPE